MSSEWSVAHVPGTDLGFMVPGDGIEPPTNALQMRRSTC